MWQSYCISVSSTIYFLKQLIVQMIMGTEVNENVTDSPTTGLPSEAAEEEPIGYDSRDN
jgi:hypothetical protein